MKSIVIPTYKHLEDCLKPCCESIIKNTNLADVEVIVVANGCGNDGTREYVESLGAPFKLVWLEEASGYTHSTNVGVQASKGDIIIFMNNDVVILDFQDRHVWVNRLCDPLKDPTVGLTGPLILHDSTVDADFPVFMLAAMRRELFDRVGPLDEIFSPGGGEDVDLSLKIQRAGYKVVRVSSEKGVNYEAGWVITDFPVYHNGEATMLDAEHKPGWQAILDRNMKILAERYPKLPEGAFWQRDIDSYRQLIDEVPDGGTICELGTWVGRSLCSVADIIKRKKLRVIAVDTFKGTANEEYNLQQAAQRDIEGEFRANIERFGISSAVSVYSMTTTQAAEYIVDQTLDLCFIDADHSYESVRKDIETWLPKIKPQGIIGGHDYSGSSYPNPSHPDVKKAVDEVFGHIRYDNMSLVWSKKLGEPQTPVSPSGPRVLAYICTKGRYDTTLPMAIYSIINQTYKPTKFRIFDDNNDAEKRDPTKIEHYNYLLKLLEQKGIPWEWTWAMQKGAHYSHEIANQSGFDFAWFIDDDCVAEPDCLEKLMDEMKDGVGAVGGLIIQPPAGPLPPNAANKIDNLFVPNIQWYKWEGAPKEVEHIYSSFLYRCNIVHHDLRLSSVVFRGETMFTYSLLLRGYKLIVTPKAITWHFQAMGGIRSGQAAENWHNDEMIFRKWLDFKKSGKKLYVLNGGLGDHYMFLSAIKPTPDSLIACCYPEALSGYQTISIADAQQLVDVKDYDIYVWCTNHNWKGHLVDAYRRMYEDFGL